jgi:hypothetical protein
MPKSSRCFPTSSRRKTVRKSRTANATPSSAGTIGTANGFARCVPSISATISSPASPSSQCWRPRATISSSPACKESSHKALYDFIDGAEPERHQEKIRKGKTVETRHYRWIERVPVRGGKDAALVNWIGFEIFDRNGRVKYSIAWVTSLPVNKTNVAEIAACGRARWKIENEAFNVMKNHGYELEHNFGHGETFLAMTLAALNLLAFAWHSALDLLEPPWQAAREAAAKRTSFFAHLLTLTTYVVFPSWAVFLEALTTFTIPPELLKTQKIE